MLWFRRLIRRVHPTTTGPEPSGSASHFIQARHEFANAFGDLARGKRNWQVIAFTLAGLLTVQVLAYIRLSSSAQLVPYVVQVDRLGQVMAAGVVDPLKSPDQRLVASQLGEFIRNIRTVLPADAAHAQAELLRRGYAFVGPEAAAFLNEHFSRPENDPRLLGTRLSRLVDVTSVLRVPSSDVWKLRWIEEGRPLHPGEDRQVRGWEGYVTVKLAAPPTAEAVEDNPLGVHITSITWAQVAETASGAPVGAGGIP